MPFQSSQPGSRRTTKPSLIIVGCTVLLAVGAAGGSAAMTLLAQDPETSLAAQVQTTGPSTPSAPTGASPATSAATAAATATSPKAAKSTRAIAPTPSNTPRSTSRPAATSKPSATKPKSTSALPVATRVTTKATIPAEAPDSFDESYARTVAGNIVEDIGTADERFSDHPEIGASTTMDFLAGDMGRLLDAGMPPVKDQAHYYALVTTLQKFYSKAADQLPDDVTGAAATYTVARENTGELLSLLNPVIGTKYKLGQWSFM